jgi:hypothetical protein
MNELTGTDIPSSVPAFERACRIYARQLRDQLDALENGPTIYDRGNAIVQIDKLYQPLLCRWNEENYEEVLNEVLNI